jgi:uncharacterized protein YdeI (YjbR/CyaY-like superfamily)
MSASHFASAADFRRWLEKNHATATELLLGFYKKASGKGGLTYPEAVDELLCFGWIDGVKRRVDDERYTHRITPRRPGSIWSLINVRHVERLTKAKRMHPAGLRAFAVRQAHKTGVYSFESRPKKLPAAYEKIFRAQPKAWSFFMAQPPGYRRLLIFKIVRAKQEATRQRWLARTIAASARGRRLE